MPGSNCAIFGCGTCRDKRNQHNEYGIFYLRKAKDEFHTKWRSDMLAVITRDVVGDDNYVRKSKSTLYGFVKGILRQMTYKFTLQENC